MQVVAVVLLYNEDVFCERVIRNVAAFCDRVHVADHMSSDRTWEIVSALAREYDHVDARRVSNSGRSHDLVQPYAGTRTWVFNPDGDEIYDPEGLRRLRAELEEGRHDHAFRLVPAMLHCVALDTAALTATGHLSPPARSGGKLFNFAAIESWTNVHRQCLHDGDVVFRPGWHWEAVANLGEERGWEGSPFRCLHACFLRRSSREPAGGRLRLNPIEANTYRRDALGRALLALRRLRRAGGATPWKLEKYRQGPLVTMDASPFLAPAVRA
jgi:glycosyltransferase involved in cell wall biosynthesis